MPVVPFLFDKDNSVVIPMALRNTDGTPFNLTGATVTLIVVGVSGSPFACTITDAANGLCNRTVTSGDFPAPGAYQAQAKTVNGVVIAYSDVFVIEVAHALG